jgi:hypothetical protein
VIIFRKLAASGASAAAGRTDLAITFIVKDGAWQHPRDPIED